MSQVRRIYVEKKPAYATAAAALLEDLKNYLGITAIDKVRILIRYDVENISDEIFEVACRSVFSEPPVDILYSEELPAGKEDKAFSVEYLPGQFDQRADSAIQCVQFLNENEQPIIKTAVTYILEGSISDEEFEKIKNYCINPVDSRLTSDKKPETLLDKYPEPEDVKILDGFTGLVEEDLKKLYDSLGLAMTFKDFIHIQKYFSAEESRDPSMTEIRVLDTYWSDHCRHTTFSTELTSVEFEDGFYKDRMLETYQNYLDAREVLYKGRDDKFICLMDLALMGMKKLRAEGKLEDMEKSDEINACSIVVPVEMDGKTEEWLIFFKNETHNHPTEIEPFGGAATCLGGAIRDPLSGRGYVYQAMRITGAADPTVAPDKTLEGKLPQKKLVTGAASGYSSYGNQIGLATGYVKEIYHPDYVAKRMEIGAVMGAAPRKNVIRGNSDPGDVIILLGGRTGRDGCGGATGSSKVHTTESIETCGAEVQKGNAPTERKLQRLFRRAEVSRLIKKCNDFGAGGVSVAIGELAPGLHIELDKVPKKYAGLDGTELAISESQERMAVVIDPKDEAEFLKYAHEENLEATKVAVVTEEPRLVLLWRGKEIVNLSRAFLDTNGAHQETEVFVDAPDKAEDYFKKIAIDKVKADLDQGDVKAAMADTLSDLNVCSQKGLVEMFDSSIGAGSVTMPYGGKYQLTETQAMIAKLPALEGKTDLVTMMSYGFDPYLSSWSPYHGAIYAVLSSLSKIVTSGGDYRKVRFTFQEYFRRMSAQKERWSQPFAALLGSLDAQLGFGLPSIGGKDSMSGSFNEIDVPPTLVSFAVDTASAGEVLTPECKSAGNKLVWISLPRTEYDLPDYEGTMKVYDDFRTKAAKGQIKSAYTIDGYGIFASAVHMVLGNGFGLKFDETGIKDARGLFENRMGDLLAEMSPADAAAWEAEAGNVTVVAQVTEEGTGYSYAGTSLSADEALKNWKKTLENVFPTKAYKGTEALEDKLFERKGDLYVCKNKVAKPTVFIPVFPGTNCEYDSVKAFERAGADTVVKVFRNNSPEDIRESVEEFEAAIRQAQMIMFPGGFSAGDEPDGSAKFFATAFRNAKIKEAVEDLLQQRDGLALGICNGFQALIKLGLVPSGKIVGQDEKAPTLTYNTIGRHISKMAYTKVVSNLSPWLALAELGKTYVCPASHGEGRFVAPKECIEELFMNGQVATRYADPEGRISMDEEWNINGSFEAIEGITSPDGRCLGKMAHAERRGENVAVNIFGEQDMKIFEAGVKYFM
ncbi:MAG: phosphoribosylformylglycinamidine synthase [Lachnospiraceae bacterium]|nr:phosphoribosylformylglycinamidine synthase [Lachnospiraceae bacterium]